MKHNTEQPPALVMENFSITAKVIGKEKEYHTVQLELPDQEANASMCCGGYCGQKLWRRMFFPNRNPPIRLALDQNFPIGSILSFSVPEKKILLFQGLLWLPPSLIFFITLAVLPSNLWALLAASLLAFTLFFLINYYYSPRIFITTKTLADKQEQSFRSAKRNSKTAPFF